MYRLLSRAPLARALRCAGSGSSLSVFSTSQSRVILAAATLALAACGDNAFAPVEPQIAAIKVAAASTVEGTTPLIPVGEVIRLVAIDAQGRELPKVDWSTSDIRRAGISDRGEVFGLGAGNVRISASLGGNHAIQELRVKERNAGSESGKIAVASVAVSPASFALPYGGTVQLSATVTATDGTLLTDRNVTWSTSNTAVGTVSRTGVVTGVGTGVVRVAAAVDGKSGIAEITIGSTQQSSPALVSSVSVSPDKVTLSSGDTLPLAAVLRAADGTALTGRMVTWTTSNPEVITVSEKGVVRAVAAGLARVTATSEGKSASAGVMVQSAGVSSGRLVTECAAPKAAWIWCDDFEQDRLSRYFEHNTHHGDFVRAAEVGLEGSSGMKARWQQAGQVGAGWMHVAFGRTPSSYMRPVDEGTRNYREIYWRFFIHYPKGWIGGGGNKITRAKVFAKSDWTEAMQALVWSSKADPEYLVLDPVSYTDASGTLTGTARWLGARKSTTSIFSAENLGRWRCIETRVRMNDAGQSNGVFTIWVDGTQTLSRTDLNWVGSYDAYGINTVSLENYWNDGAPQAQERYFDNLVVSTERIGC